MNRNCLSMWQWEQGGGWGGHGILQSVQNPRNLRELSLCPGSLQSRQRSPDQLLSKFEQCQAKPVQCREDCDQLVM